MATEATWGHFGADPGFSRVKRTPCASGPPAPQGGPNGFLQALFEPCRGARDPELNSRLFLRFVETNDRCAPGAQRHNARRVAGPEAA
eukprot:7225203-Pyramimonas_sp.AAC.1